MEEDTIQKKKEKKKLILYAIIATVIILTIIMIPVIRSNLDKPVDFEFESGITFMPDDDTTVSYISFHNSEFFKETFGSSMASDILDSIQSMVLDGYSKTVQLDANINIQSLSQTVYFPYTVYSMILEISDSNNVSVSLATNNNKYTGVLVGQTTDKGVTQKLYIVFSRGASESSYDRDSVISGLTKWAKKTAGVSEILVSTKN